MFPRNKWASQQEKYIRLDLSAKGKKYMQPYQDSIVKSFNESEISSLVARKLFLTRKQ
jgi:hypothetical protein